MLTSTDAWCGIRRAALLAVCLTFAIADVVAQVPAAPVRAGPNALLSIDQNRATVVDRIVAEWGDELAHSTAGIDATQLRLTLQAMRADHLLAASLAGSLDGLRSIIATSLAGPEVPIGKSGAVAKALGDAADDLTYTPVTPCRLVETRGLFAAVYQGDGSAAHVAVPFTANQIRNYTVQGGNGVCLTQLPAGLNPSGIQLQVFGIPIGGSSGDVEILPQGSAFGNTATLVYLGNVLLTSASATVRINPATNQIGVQVRGGGAHLAIDVVGYFAAPAATGLQCTQVTSASTTIAVSTDTLVPLPNCAAGYARTGSSCSGAANIPGGYLVETNTTGCLFRNLSAVATYPANATSTCCRIPGR